MRSVFTRGRLADGWCLRECGPESKISNSDLHCPYCDNQHLVQRVTRRNSRANLPTCPECGHQDDPYCRCKNCQRIRAEQAHAEEEIKRGIIEDLYAASTCTAPHLNDVTLKDAAYLTSLLRHSVTEELEFVDPFNTQSPPFAPTFDFSNDIVKHLYSKGLIGISDQSKTDAFVFDDAWTETEAYYPTKVFWELFPGVEQTAKLQFIKSLDALVDDQNQWPEPWFNEISALCHLIGKYECIEYYLYQLEKRDFSIDKIGPKTHTVFEDLLTKFSVSQIYGLSWQAIRDTTDYNVREGIPAYRAKNNFIGAIQRKADRYLSQGWEVKGYRRDFGCPQSVLSATFFNVFDGTGDKAFETKPPTK